MKDELVYSGEASQFGSEQSAYTPVSQSCTVAQSEHSWRATGQSNLADRMADCSIGQSAAV